MPNGLKTSLSDLERQIYHQMSRLNLPRHTSYPAANLWPKIAADASRFPIKLSELTQTGREISFYVHIPFCEKLCHYCACNKLIISRANEQAGEYGERLMAGLKEEIEDVARFGRFKIKQLHFGGGTPTWLAPTDFEKLWDLIVANCDIASDAEISIELDPRITTNAHLKLLKELGFNRLSLGIQDFDKSVQTAIERHQPYEMVETFVGECRQLGFLSINFDLIYGLPRQTQQSMAETLKKVIKLNPDRLAFYRLALIPEVFKWQRTFKSSDIPSDELILNFALSAIDVFESAGYRAIGLDHFAKRDDSLAMALEDGTLRRSFQGMTTGETLPVIGIGPTAISCLDDFYTQNEVQFQVWTKSPGVSRKSKEYQLSRQDIAVRWAINQLYCYRLVKFSEFYNVAGLDFPEFYQTRWAAFEELQRTGLLTVGSNELKLVGLLGGLLTRVVAAVLDMHLPADAWKFGLEAGQASRVG